MIQVSSLHIELQKRTYFTVAAAQFLISPFVGLLFIDHLVCGLGLREEFVRIGFNLIVS